MSKIRYKNTPSDKLEILERLRKFFEDTWRTSLTHKKTTYNLDLSEETTCLEVFTNLFFSEGEEVAFGRASLDSLRYTVYRDNEAIITGFLLYD